jgi:diguanylate cyclase (GGDEF)-like protein/PAS domain S-box-containing protein
VSVLTASASASGREFQSLVEQIPAVTYIADFVGSFRLRYVSPQCRTMLGYEPDDWVADADAWVRAIHPDDRQRIIEEAEACIAAERPFDFEYRMLTADGRVLHFWEKTSFVRDDRGRPIAVTGVMLDVTDLKVAQEEILRHEEERAEERAKFEAALKRQLAERLYQASHDDLTGLPNRRSLNTKLSEALASGKPMALLLLDLDRFKEVNDVLGHHYGDQLLCAVAERFRPVLRANDFLARIGGDEFALVLHPLQGIDDAIAIAERLGRALAEPFSLNDVPVYMEASVGIALHPEHGSTAGELMQRADVAMYGAKAAKSGWQLYQASSRPSPKRVSRLAELRTAVDANQLLLHYQPKIELGSGEIIGVEALVRWLHPEHGLIMPGEFVPLVEQTGLIRPLTTFVLADALRQWRVWADAGSELTIAVNIAPRTLGDLDFAELVEVLLGEYSVPARTLELEVTESSLMGDAASSSDMLQRLQQAGVKIVLDDYGTGYSSLSRLRNLPIDEIKIDKQFVTSIDTDAHSSEILRSTIALGHSLGMRVVAEGVEDAIVLAQLAALGCDAAQGYHIALPLPADGLAGLIRRR